MSKTDGMGRTRYPPAAFRDYFERPRGRAAALKHALRACFPDFPTGCTFRGFHTTGFNVPAMPDHPIDPDPRSEALSRATRIARRLRRQRDAARRETESLRAQLAAADVLLNAAMCLIEFPKSDQ